MGRPDRHCPTNDILTLPVSKGTGSWAWDSWAATRFEKLSAAAGAPKDVERNPSRVQAGKDGKGHGVPWSTLSLASGMVRTWSQEPPSFLWRGVAAAGPEGRGVTGRSSLPSMPAFLEQGARELSSFWVAWADVRDSK